MKCPKCGEKASKNDKVCRNCGTVLKKEKLLPSLFSRKKTPAANSNVPALETSLPSGGGSAKYKYLKAGIFAVGIFFIILLIVLLIVHFSSGKGQKKAQALAELIGTNITASEKELDIVLKDNSGYAAVNKNDSFDYIYESDDDVEIDDITFPEWAVTVMKTSSEKIDTVIYTDYRVLKSDSRGQKLDKRINLEKFDRTSKASSVIDYIGIDPFRITYDVRGTKYEFRYFYKMDNGDMQSVKLTVISDAMDIFFYSASEDLSPFFISNNAPSARADQLLQN